MATATAPAAAASDVTDGPVLTLINKRIRNLKKKLNRIAQLEESVAQGKSAVKNKEQEDLLKSKPSIVAAVDELEKFRQPLSVAVDEEIALAVKQSRTSEVDSGNVTETLSNENDVTETLGDDRNETAPSVEVIEDLLKLIYFGNMFDVKSQNDFNSIMLTRTHERNCCLTYDYVTDDDAAVMLGESDLDLLSKMSSLLISRPVDLSASHQNALQRCVEHAKLWLAKSEQTIDSDSSVTYAALREKLTKIIGSDYLKITPEMKAPAVVAAEAAGNYAFQVPVQADNTVTPHEQTEDNSTDSQRNETHEDQSGQVEHSPELQEPEAENTIETQVQVEQNETNTANTENKEQYVPRRYNQRGGGGGRSNGGGRGGRGYGGGRGGRSGGRGGPYQNGRNQYYEPQGNYYPSNQRNYYGGRGRGGRGGGSGNGNGNNGYNHHHGAGVEVAES